MKKKPCEELDAEFTVAMHGVVKEMKDKDAVRVYIKNVMKLAGL